MTIVPPPDPNEPPVQLIIDAINEGYSLLSVRGASSQATQLKNDLIRFIQQADAQFHFQSYCDCMNLLNGTIPGWRDTPLNQFPPNSHIYVGIKDDEIACIIDRVNQYSGESGCSILFKQPLTLPLTCFSLKLAAKFFQSFLPPSDKQRYNEDLKEIVSYGLPLIYQDIAIHGVLHQLYCTHLNNDYFIAQYAEDSAKQKGFSQGYIDLFITLIDPYDPSTAVYESHSDFLTGIQTFAKALDSNNLIDAQNVLNSLSQKPTTVPWWPQLITNLSARLRDYVGTQDKEIFGILMGMVSLASCIAERASIKLNNGILIPGENGVQDGTVFTNNTSAVRMYYAVRVFRDYVGAKYWADLFAIQNISMCFYAFPDSLIFFYENLWDIPSKEDSGFNQIAWINRLYALFHPDCANVKVCGGLDAIPPACRFDKGILESMRTNPEDPFTAADFQSIQLFSDGDGGGIWSCSDVLNTLANPPDSNHPTAIYGKLYDLGVYANIKKAVLNFYVVWSRHLPTV